MQVDAAIYADGLVPAVDSDDVQVDARAVLDRYRLTAHQRHQQAMANAAMKHRRVSSLNLVIDRGFMSQRAPPERVREHLPADFGRFKRTCSQVNRVMGQMMAKENTSQIRLRSKKPSMGDLRLSLMSPGTPAATGGLRATSRYALNRPQRNASIMSMSKGTREESSDYSLVIDSSMKVKNAQSLQAAIDEYDYKIEATAHLLDQCRAGASLESIFTHQQSMIDQQRRNTLTNARFLDRKEASASSVAERRPIAAHLGIGKSRKEVHWETQADYQQQLMTLYSLMQEVGELEEQFGRLTTELQKTNAERAKVELLEALFEERARTSHLDKMAREDFCDVDKKLESSLGEAQSLERELNRLQSLVLVESRETVRGDKHPQYYKLATLGSRLKLPTMSSTQLPTSEEQAHFTASHGVRASLGQKYSPKNHLFNYPVKQAKVGTFQELARGVSSVRRSTQVGTLTREHDSRFGSKKANEKKATITLTKRESTFTQHSTPPRFSSLDKKRPLKQATGFGEQLSNTLNQDTHEEFKANEGHNINKNYFRLSSIDARAQVGKGHSESPESGGQVKRTNEKSATVLKRTNQLPIAFDSQGQRESSQIELSAGNAQRSGKDHLSEARHQKNSPSQNNDGFRYDQFTRASTKSGSLSPVKRAAFYNSIANLIAKGGRSSQDLRRPADRQFTPGALNLAEIEETLQEDTETKMNKKSSKKTSGENPLKGSSATEGQSLSTPRNEVLKNPLAKNKVSSLKSPLLADLAKKSERVGKPVARHSFRAESPEKQYLATQIVKSSSYSELKLADRKIDKSKSNMRFVAGALDMLSPELKNRARLEANSVSDLSQFSRPKQTAPYADRTSLEGSRKNIFDTEIKEERDSESEERPASYVFIPLAYGRETFSSNSNGTSSKNNQSPNGGLSPHNQKTGEREKQEQHDQLQGQTDLHSGARGVSQIVEATLGKNNLKAESENESSEYSRFGRNRK